MKTFLSTNKVMSKPLKQLLYGFGSSLIVAAAIFAGLSATRNADALSVVWGGSGSSQASTSQTITTSNMSNTVGSVANGGDNGSSAWGTASQQTSQPVSQTAPAAGNRFYAALGDSVAAGLGLPLVNNPSASDQQCGRSSQSYPYAVAANRNLPIIFAACSGATAGDLNTQQRVDGSNPQRQIDTAFANGIPSLITVTAGANDVHWQSFIKKCYAATCGTTFDNATFSTLLAAAKLKLSYFLAETKVRSSNTPPPVILTGYYYPVSAACTTQQFTAAEINWLRASADKLNQAIQQTAAAYNFAHYAPVDFSGHDLCSSDPWIQGLTAAAPIHPTAAGQQAIANSVLRTLGN